MDLTTGIAIGLIGVNDLTCDEIKKTGSYHSNGRVWQLVRQAIKDREPCELGKIAASGRGDCYLGVGEVSMLQVHAQSPGGEPYLDKEWSGITILRVVAASAVIARMTELTAPKVVLLKA